MTPGDSSPLQGSLFCSDEWKELRVQAQRHRSGTGFTALHLVQPVDGGVARVVLDLVGAQVDAGVRVAVACPAEGPLAEAAGR
ncbi:hypothetical protein GA0115259_110075, partial [Streptomyces sp. MnatMP-M17]